MKKIVPFKKEIIFNTNLFEITSISLEHSLKINEDTVSGSFTVSGEYKITEQSVDVEQFSYDLPFSIAFDPKYILSNSTLDIEDFYYEIVNDKVLSINIEVSVDNIEEKKIEDEIKEPIERCVEEETEKNSEEDINIFNNISVEDSYNTYKVYIVRENDTLDSIIEKYNTKKEQLEEYNDLSEIKIGNKIIIPLTNETD